MKTIDEIISREDYKRMNEALIGRAIELAKKLRDVCLKMDFEVYDSFKLGGRTFQVRRVKSSSGFSEWHLYMFTERDLVALDERCSYYFCNDFNCWVTASNNTEKLDFLNHAKQIFADIESEMDARVKEIKNALENCEGL